MEKIKQWKNMSEEELEKLIKEKEDLIEDTKEMMEFNLRATTAHHVPGYLRKQYEDDIKMLQEEIESIKKILAEK